MFFFGGSNNDNDLLKNVINYIFLCLDINKMYINILLSKIVSYDGNTRLFFYKKNFYNFMNYIRC